MSIRLAVVYANDGDNGIATVITDAHLGQVDYEWPETPRGEHVPILLRTLLAALDLIYVSLTINGYRPSFRRSRRLYSLLVVQGRGIGREQVTTIVINAIKAACGDEEVGEIREFYIDGVSKGQADAAVSWLLG